ncbi:MAG: hypothetical protein R6V49_00270 [Bacteroidales bacterium]
MRRYWLMTAGVMCCLLVHPHSDPYFIFQRPPWEQLSSDSRGVMALCNPAWSSPGLRYHWICGVHNQQSVRQLNTLWLGGAFRFGERFSLAGALRHAPLPENHYLRTAGALSGSLYIAPQTAVGLSIRMTRIRLPANLGSMLAVGSMAGLVTRVGKKTEAAFAAGLHKNPGDGTGYSILSTEIRHHLTTNAVLGISADMTSGMKPNVCAFFFTDLPSGIRITISSGNGPDRLQAGILIPFRNFGAGTTLAYNPLAGNSSSMMLTGKKDMP